MRSVTEVSPSRLYKAQSATSLRHHAPANRHHTAIRSAAVLALAVLSVAPLQSAYSDTPNAWLRGSRTQLEQLATRARQHACHAALCPLPLAPIVLSAKTASSRQVRITLTSAHTTAPVAKAPTQGVSAANLQIPSLRRKGPVLLRGWLQVPSMTRDLSASRRQLPVAATLTHSDTGLILFVTLPTIKHTRANSYGRLSALRAVVSELSISHRRNARAEPPSRTAFTSLQCGTPHTQAFSRTSQGSALRTLSADSTTYPTLYIATDFDPLFSTRLRCSSVPACNDTIVRIIHEAAVFYETQLGYTLTVARQFGPTQLGDVTVSTEVLNSAQQASLLPRLQFLHTGVNTSENQVDLFQFFTGRTMDSKTIGIAYVGTLCKNDRSEFSQAVVQHVSDGLNPVTTAHEIGHTLSATHTATGIMRANLGSNTPRQFSSASLLEISGYLDSWYPECRQGLAQGVSTPTPTPQPGGGAGGAPNPYNGKPITLNLTILSPAPKTVTLTATVTSVSAQCSVTIRAGATTFRALRGEPLIQFTPTDLTTVKTGAASFKVKPTTVGKSNVYFVAEHSCADGTILEVSRVRKFRANSVRGTSRAERSKKSWIAALRQSVR